MATPAPDEHANPYEQSSNGRTISDGLERIPLADGTSLAVPLVETVEAIEAIREKTPSYFEYTRAVAALLEELTGVKVNGEQADEVADWLAERFWKKKAERRKRIADARGSLASTTG